MFTKLVVFSGLLAVVLTLQQQQVPIIAQSEDVSPDGSFQWNYQSGDGSSQQAAGQQRQIGKESGQVIQGSASWADPQGGQHQLQYVADENGYQPQSADLPVAPVGPEIPAQIVRALNWIAAHPQPQYQQE